MLATGGATTVTAEGGRFFRVHRFDASGSFNVLRTGRVECVIVGGGGGGGFRLGGGGGAGGAWKFVAGEADNNLENTVALAQGIFPIIVGAGGSGGVVGARRGTTGTSSTAFGIVAQGGGGGGGNQFGVLDGASGASGGGGCYTAAVSRPNGGANISPQGNPGGSIPAGGGNSPGVSAGGGGRVWECRRRRHVRQYPDCTSRERRRGSDHCDCWQQPVPCRRRRRRRRSEFFCGIRWAWPRWRRKWRHFRSRRTRNRQLRWWRRGRWC